jgi:uncharacterized protein
VGFGNSGVRSATLAPLLIALAVPHASSAEMPARGDGAVRPVAIADVRWTGGFWKERFDVCRAATIPALWRIMRGTEHSQFLQNFLIAAGRAEGRHRGPAFNDGDFYKWVEAAAAVQAVAPDPAVAAALDEAVAAIRAAQRPDGYVHTRIQIRQRQGDRDAREFHDPLQFETYNLGHLMTAGCVHHRATGKPDLLAAARSAADYLDCKARHPTPEFARCAVCPSHYMGLVDLSRETGERRYLELAAGLLALRDRVSGGTDDNQDRIPFREQSRAVGHAVRANYLYASAADVALETGDPALRRQLEALWSDVVGTKLAVTGGCGALYDGASPDGAKDQKQIARVHQAYGRPYQLPQATAHNETCAAVGLALWASRMLRLTGEAKYADTLELVLYNAALVGVSLDGTRFFYTNPLRTSDPPPADLRWPRERQPFLSSFCCPPNLARTVAETATYAYGVSDRSVWVHLYGANSLTTDLPAGERMTLTQTTDYPWDGRVRLAVTPVRPATFSVFLRIPAWATGATAVVNGTPTSAPTPGMYFEIQRAWSTGDVVDLTLPLRPGLLETNPLVEEARGQVAIRRGPVVYCLESRDLPAGIRVQDVAIPAGVDLRPRIEPGLLGGAAVLEGQAVAYPARDWGRDLYREMTPAAAKPIKMRLIPYYAWANRGPSEISVLLPLVR